MITIEKIYKRIEINAPISERDVVFKYLDENNYHIISQGPLIRTFSDIDLNIFHVVAEKEI